MGCGWDLCLGPTGLEKALGAVGVGLRLNGTEGTQACPLPLVSEGRGPHLGAQQASWAQVGGANALLSSTAPPVLEGPSHLPLLFSPQPPSYAPRTNEARRRGCLGGQGTGLRAQQAPWVLVGGAIALLSSLPPPRGPLPPASPDLPGLRGANPIWSPLLLPPSPPTPYRFTWGFLPSPWASGSRTSVQQAP